MSPKEVQEIARRPRRRGCCLIWLVLILIGACGGSGVGVLRTLGDEPNAIRVTAAIDRTDLVVGDTFIIELTVENVDVDPVLITGVSLENSLADGVQIMTTDPGYRSVKDRSIPLVNDWTEYRLDRRLGDGDTLVITMTLMAQQVGTYSGDVSVWVEYELLGWKVSRARRANVEVTVR
ncbi:MAG: hypothetical protein JXQ72_04140 [Anaerolineae bacterium]|nr:hypothetical protein [Anaerolineae bacterium]